MEDRLIIRTRFTLEELEKIKQYHDCPCAPNNCIDMFGHWGMWQPQPEGLYWLTTWDFEDNLFIYRYKEHVFAMEWEGVIKSQGEVLRYLESIKERERV